MTFEDRLRRVFAGLDDDGHPDSDAMWRDLERKDKEEAAPPSLMKDLQKQTDDFVFNHNNRASQWTEIHYGRMYALVADELAPRGWQYTDGSDGAVRYGMGDLPYVCIYKKDERGLAVAYVMDTVYASGGQKKPEDFPVLDSPAEVTKWLVGISPGAVDDFKHNYGSSAVDYRQIPDVADMLFEAYGPVSEEFGYGEWGHGQWKEIGRPDNLAKAWRMEIPAGSFMSLKNYGTALLLNMPGGWQWVYVWEDRRKRKITDGVLYPTKAAATDAMDKSELL